MNNLNVTVTVQEGKSAETRKLTSFVIGASIVKAELAGYNAEAKLEKIKQIAQKFLTEEQKALHYTCVVEGA